MGKTERDIKLMIIKNPTVSSGTNSFAFLVNDWFFRIKDHKSFF